MHEQMDKYFDAEGRPINPIYTIETYDEAIPAGVYKAEFISYELKDHVFQDGSDSVDPRQQAQFVAKITEGDHFGQEILGWCSLPKDQHLSSRSKLAKWGTAILGDTKNFDLDSILHKPCHIVVSQVQSNKNDGSLFSKIQSVYSATGVPPAPTEPPRRTVADF